MIEPGHWHCVKNEAFCIKVAWNFSDLESLPNIVRSWWLSRVVHGLCAAPDYIDIPGTLRSNLDRMVDL